ncbi:VOC family protein [Olivibacter sp. SDN3]|uniref:VOC family protein n=1 Tax=Olivibacter sp. SDN3 TaxID=2764720 RepID=UPI00210409D2|nr:VOC family protein [Olivibacter sp. SDN3]
MMNILKVIVILIIAFFPTDKLQAQQSMTRLNHIAIYVENLEKSTFFYKEVLQLTEIDEPFKDGLHTWFSLGPAGQLHLIEGAKSDIPRDKNDHLCFSVPSVDHYIKHLDKHAVSYADWAGNSKKITIRVDGVKQIYFQDPDGHWIEINDDKTAF